MSEVMDLVIVGAGASGLMAAIAAGREACRSQRSLRIVALDGASRLGAKILVSGGGRCNVTHDVVDERLYSGSSPKAIRKVLQQFPATQTVEFFADLGVRLKREETGKLFPVTDDAKTVLEALLGAAQEAGVQFRCSSRVQHILPAESSGYRLIGSFGKLLARHVILATGGMSCPKTGSDGMGYRIAQELGHSISPQLLPALVPLVLTPDHFIRSLSGLTLNTTLELQSASGKRLAAMTDSTLCTHFGLSGPSVLNISRHYLHAASAMPGVQLVINWLPGETAEGLDATIVKQARFRGTVGLLRLLGERLPTRLAKAILEYCCVPAHLPLASLSREQRRALVAAIVRLPLPVTGSRGFAEAEVTAGGIPLNEIHLDRMESRVCPSLYLCGEICDVDGCIGGYNFQWAWASGYVAGKAAAHGLGHG